MQSRQFTPCRVLTGAIVTCIPTLVLAATVSGTVTFPVSDAGYGQRVVGARVRVQGTALAANVAEVDGTYSGTFTLGNVPMGAVTLIVEEPPASGGVTGDRFTQDSKRVDLVVSGDVTGVEINTVHHWRNLPSYPPPYHNPNYDQWEPFFASADVGFMSFLNRGVNPFEHELWRTTNGGQSWQEIGHWNWSTSAMKPDFSGPSLMFVDADHGVMRGVDTLYGQYGVMRTANGGQTWEYIDLPNAPPVGNEPGGNGLVSIINYAAIDGTHWIICGPENVGSYMGSGTPGWITFWETADAGATWQIGITVREDYGTCSALGALPDGRAFAFDTPYAFGGNRLRFLRDVNGVWTVMAGNWSDPNGNDLVTNTGYGTADAPTLGTDAWISGARWQGHSTVESGVYRSTDGGVTWTWVSGALLQSLDFANPLRGYSTAGGPVYASYDGFKTWRFQAQGGGSCCHGNYVFAFSPTDVYWRDGGVGDPNGMGDVQRYFEQASPNLEVLMGNGVGNSVARNGATNVPVAAFTVVSSGLTDLSLQPLRVRASGTGNDQSEIDLVTLWWDRDADGAVTVGDTAISTATYNADNGLAELGLGGVAALHQLYPRQLLVTYNLSPKAREGRTFSAALESSTVEAFTDDQASTRVIATAPSGTVLAGATITVAASVPIPSAIAPQTSTENEAFGFSVPAFTDPNGDPLTYSFTGLPAWLTVAYPATNPRYVSGRPPYSESSATTNKSYTITVSAQDPDGNSASTSFSLTVLNVNRPPVPPTIANKIAYEAKPFGYSVPIFSDPDGDVLTYTFTGLPAWLSVSHPETNPRYISGTAPLTVSSPQGNVTYVVTLTATDTSGASAARSFNVVVADNRYPVPGAITNQTATENVAFSYNMPAFTDPDGDTITYTFYGLPSWLAVTSPSVNPRYISGRPPYTESTRTTNKVYTVTVNARDAVGQTTQRTFTVTVLNVNRPPVPPTIPDQTGFEGSAFSFNAPRFTDPDGDAMTYAFSGLPAWLSVTEPAVNDRYISGRPPYTEATPGNPAVYAITMTATDAGGAAASRTFNLTVQDVPQ